MTDETLPVKKRGRRPQSVLKRLGREGQLDEHSWPDRASPCWDGPELISYGGTMCRTPRACLNDTMPTQLTSTQQLQSVCKRDGCINPHHYRIADRRNRSGEPTVPLPDWAFMQHVLEDAEREKNKPPQERLMECAMDVRLALNSDPDLSDADLAARFQHAYTEELIREARTVEL